MITEHELKEQCTPEFIKWMCELAEGFEFIDGRNEYNFNGYNTYWDNFESSDFILLIHRAVEGWNKYKKGEDCIVISDDNLILWCADLDDCKIYDFKEYQPQTLTQAECAELHCLIDVFETGGER